MKHSNCSCREQSLRIDHTRNTPHSKTLPHKSKMLVGKKQKLMVQCFIWQHFLSITFFQVDLTIVYNCLTPKKTFLLLINRRMKKRYPILLRFFNLNYLFSKRIFHFRFFYVVKVNISLFFKKKVKTTHPYIRHWVAKIMGLERIHQSLVQKLNYFLVIEMSFNKSNSYKPIYCNGISKFGSQIKYGNLF